MSLLHLSLCRSGGSCLNPRKRSRVLKAMGTTDQKADRKQKRNGLSGLLHRQRKQPEGRGSSVLKVHLKEQHQTAAKERIMDITSLVTTLPGLRCCTSLSKSLMHRQECSWAPTSTIPTTTPLLNVSLVPQTAGTLLAAAAAAAKGTRVLV